MIFYGSQYFGGTSLLGNLASFLRKVMAPGVTDELEGGLQRYSFPPSEAAEATLRPLALHDILERLRPHA